MRVRPRTRALTSPDHDTTFNFTLGSHTPILSTFADLGTIKFLMP